MEAIQRAAVPALQVKISTVSESNSTPNPSVGECLQADLDMAIGADASSLDPKVARTLPETVAATWEVHRLQEILSTASRVSGSSEKPVTQKDQVMNV
jgi:hypothetical protein